MTDYKWTKIDPSVHTQEFFDGKAVTFVYLDQEPNWRWFKTLMGPTDSRRGEMPVGATHFLLHPPLPGPIEEEIERAADNYSNRLPGEGYNEPHAAFIAGAKAFMGRGK